MSPSDEPAQVEHAKRSAKCKTAQRHLTALAQHHICLDLALSVPSLQAKHSRRCALGRSWTSLDGVRTGCTCPDGPVYYVVVREGEQIHRELVGRDREQAEIALLRLEDSVEDGDLSAAPEHRILRLGRSMAGFAGAQAVDR